MKFEKGQDDFLSLAKSLQLNKQYLVLARQLEAAERKRIILDRESEEPYLVRYYYVNYRPFCRIVLHHVLRSDVDGLHDHPWPAQTYVLSGGYWENKFAPNGVDVERVWREPGYHGQFSANYYHRLELDKEKAGEDTWTLFMMGPAEKDWGFLDNGKWVQYEEYISKRKSQK